MFVNKDPKYFQALNIFLKSRFQGWLVKKTTGRRTSQLVITEEEEVHCRWLSCVPLRMRLLQPRLSEVACRSCNTAYLSLRCAENCSTSRAAVKSAILFSIDVDPMEEREEEREEEVELFFVLLLEASITSSSSSSNLTQALCSILNVSCFTARVELRWEAVRGVT